MPNYCEIHLISTLNLSAIGPIKKVDFKDNAIIFQALGAVLKWSMKVYHVRVSVSLFNTCINLLKS